MDRSFPYDPDEFQQRKKARIEELRKPQGMAISHLFLTLTNIGFSFTAVQRCPTSLGTHKSRNRRLHAGSSRIRARSRQ